MDQQSGGKGFSTNLDICHICKAIVYYCRCNMNSRESAWPEMRRGPVPNRVGGDPHESRGRFSDFDISDRSYRNTSLDRVVEQVSAGYSLEARYDSLEHRFIFVYRGCGFWVSEKQIMWETYPMDALASILREKIQEINNLEDFGWTRREEQLSRSEMIAVLERLDEDATS